MKVKSGKTADIPTGSLITGLVDWLLPFILFFIFFKFYNLGQFTPKEMIKTTGLMAITLLGITLVIGPLGYFREKFNLLKIHRKFWGILSFLFGLLHAGLVTNFYYHLDFSKFVDFGNPKYAGILMGLSALAILFLITVTSGKFALTKMHAKVWKTVQTLSYLALMLAVFHFYLTESVNGILVFKKLSGQLVFGFSLAVIIVRVAVFFLPRKR